MKLKSILALLSCISLAQISPVALGYSWEGFKSFVHELTAPTKKPASEKSDQRQAAQPASDEVNNNDTVDDSISESSNNPLNKPLGEFSYDTLGIELYEKKFHLLRGDVNRKKTLLEESLKKGMQYGVKYFVSLERDYHEEAIKIFDELLSPQDRVSILLNAPAPFIGKILVDMKTKDFKDKSIFHWGPFDVESEYFGTSLKLEQALVKGEFIPALYIRLILFFLYSDPNDKKAMVTEIETRKKILLNILQSVPSEDVAKLLVYSPKDTAVAMGNENPKCIGQVKTSGECATEMHEHPFPLGLIFYYFMELEKTITHTSNSIFLTRIAIIEALVKNDTEERAREFIVELGIKQPTVLKDLMPSLSEEAYMFIPETIVISMLSTLEEINNTTLLLSDSSTTVPVNQTIKVDEENLHDEL